MLLKATRITILLRITFPDCNIASANLFSSIGLSQCFTYDFMLLQPCAFRIKSIGKCSLLAILVDALLPLLAFLSPILTMYP